MADDLADVDERERSGAPSLRWMVVWVVIVGGLTAVSLFPFPLGCALAENVETGSHWDVVCDEVSKWYFGGVLATVVPTIIGAVSSRRANRLNRFVWGILIGLALGALPWLLLGDPAGNFDGLLDLGTG